MTNLATGGKKPDSKLEERIEHVLFLGELIGAGILLLIATIEFFITDKFDDLKRWTLSKLSWRERAKKQGDGK